MAAKCRSVYPKSLIKETVEVAALNRPKPRKIKQEAAFAIVLALGAICLAPGGAQAQASRQEGPIKIEKCQTIDKPGSYKLVNNLTFTGSTGTCLTITTSFVTIDLAGFTISGPGNLGSASTARGTGIAAGNDAMGVAVRNGTISGFTTGVDLGGDSSVVEGLRVFGVGCPCDTGIAAMGIVTSNTVVGVLGPALTGTGISATGIVTGNYALGNNGIGLSIGQGSTVLGNTVTASGGGAAFGIAVSCPSNVTNNTSLNSGLILNGNGCNNTNNVAP
jgi:hypothetical protein